MTLESALIKDNEKIICKYYEIENVCQKIVEDYCAISKENADTFFLFAENYNTFRPFFDFVICHLKYKMLNPELEEGKILYGMDNHMYVKNIDESKEEKGFRYGLSDDLTLNKFLMPMDSTYFEDCLIDGHGYHILPKDMFGHVHIMQQILNLLLISNKEVCEDYMISKIDKGTFLQRYYPLFRFQADSLGRKIIVRGTYRSDNITEQLKLFIEQLCDNNYSYPGILYDLTKIDKYTNSKDLSDSLTYNKEEIKDFKL